MTVRSQNNCWWGWVLGGWYGAFFIYCWSCWASCYYCLQNRSKCCDVFIILVRRSRSVLIYNIADNRRDDAACQTTLLLLLTTSQLSARLVLRARVNDARAVQASPLVAAYSRSRECSSSRYTKSWITRSAFYSIRTCYNIIKIYNSSQKLVRPQKLSYHYQDMKF